MGRPGQINLKLERKQWHPTPVPLPRKSHGWRSLVGCSPWALEESDMTEWLLLLFPLSWIGEGNGNPLQCSCLENPRDRGAWWAAIYGVTQSWTLLKRLSSLVCKVTCSILSYLINNLEPRIETNKRHFFTQSIYYRRINRRSMTIGWIILHYRRRIGGQVDSEKGVPDSGSHSKPLVKVAGQGSSCPTSVQHGSKP